VADLGGSNPFSLGESGRQMAGVTTLRKWKKVLWVDDERKVWISDPADGATAVEMGIFPR